MRMHPSIFQHSFHGNRTAVTAGIIRVGAFFFLIDYLYYFSPSLLANGIGNFEGNFLFPVFIRKYVL